MTNGEIFDAVVPRERLSPSFVAVATGRGYAPAREMIRRLHAKLGARDGNFREQFQTGGGYGHRHFSSWRLTGRSAFSRR